MRGVAPPTHRQRVGSWRVMAQLEKNLIRIMRVLHRREVYETVLLGATGDTAAGRLRR